MITAIIRAKTGKKESIIAKSRDLIESSRLDYDCINYNLYASTEDGNLLLMAEQWQNLEALQMHM